MKEVLLSIAMIFSLGHANAQDANVTFVIKNDKTTIDRTNAVAIIEKPRVEFSKPVLGNSSIFYINSSSAGSVCEKLGYDAYLTYDTAQIKKYSYYNANESRFVVANSTYKQNVINSFLTCKLKGTNPREVRSRNGSITYTNPKITANSITLDKTNNVAIINNPRYSFDNPIIGKLKTFYLSAGTKTTSKVCEAFGYEKIVSYKSSDVRNYTYFNNSRFYLSTTRASVITDYISCSRKDGEIRETQVADVETRLTTPTYVADGITLDKDNNRAVISKPRVKYSKSPLPGIDTFYIYADRSKLKNVCSAFGFLDVITYNTSSRRNFVFYGNDNALTLSTNDNSVVSDHLTCTMGEELRNDGRTGLQALLEEKGIFLNMAEISKLKNLDLSGISISKVDQESLIELQDLKSLNLSNSNFHNVNFLKLLDVKNKIISLNLSGNYNLGGRADYSSLLILNEMPNLRYLIIKGTSFSINSSLAKRLRDKGIKIIK